MTAIGDLLGRLRAYAFLAMMTYVALFTLFLFAAIQPIALVDRRAHRSLGSWLLRVCVPGFLLPPAMAGLKIQVDKDQWQMMLRARLETLLHIVMCNHGSRVDWLLALMCGYTHNPIRVSFLTEGPMQFLPIVGWFRKLCEDIFVWRSFKGDKGRIDANIGSFKQTRTPRAIFLAIEGAIVDHGAFDVAYINDCRQFCESLGYAPFEYLLTPRYKGVHTLAQHAGTHLYCATVAFEQGGKMLNCKLTDPGRVVPDLYSVLRRGTNVTVHFSKLVVGADQNEAKRQCMDNYKYRDELLAHYDAHGCFPGGLRYDALPWQWPSRVSSFVAQVLLGHALASAAGMPLLVAKTLVALFCLLGACHTAGELLSGESRESIPFETIFKSYAYAGRDRKLLAKAKKAEGSPDNVAEAITETVSETAKMFSLMTKFPAN
eukprot:CAMPEP_0206003508 /NCGR_PEP_ID=MMETSP1464-20131121/3414_1 /ASSEMBLY_ACC=CAM_ASM_001124 /TAXON_ID=119497 /ORGANISM="Exanthemachrysis gayraliae, Strain RCC1523" /LENGTH=430 /DNA_ID=CAMNT_0053376883 /DNA_START=47 /DNA_END=1339 /DNA_ORIENTATION=+